MSEELTSAERAETPEQQNELFLRRKKLEDLKAAGRDPFTIVKYDRDSLAAQIKADFASYENKEVSVAGRIMSRRIMGKASFATIADNSGTIQSYISINDLGEEAYSAFKKMDIGDIVGIKGFVFLTRTGEISVHAHSLTLLAKSLLPLPEKFHGLKDVDTRYRQRYLDLIVNPEVKETFVKRSRILSEIRAYLDGKGFLEVDTPILTPFEIGATARPFKTHHNTLDMDMYLRIETELYLKRLIVGGFDKVYEVGRIFRNEGMDTKHNPEFTSIELYQAYTDYKGMMDLVEELYLMLAEKICGGRVITYQGTQIDMGCWERMTMAESVKKYAGVDYYDWKSDEDARNAAKEKHVEVAPDATKGTVLAELFDAFVEENLIQPTFIYDYPVEISPLAKKKADDPLFTERFEYFINATEYGNAFSELNDPVDQKERFERQVAEKKKQEPDTSAQVDYDYVTALEYGLAPTGGLGFGIDRLVMLLTDSASIRDVLLFPTMKPIDDKKPAQAGENGTSDSSETAQETAPAAPVIEGAPIISAEKPDFSNVKIEPLFEDFVDFETFSKSDFRAVKVLECEAVPKSKKLLKFTLDDGTSANRTILSGIHAFYEPEQLVGKTCIAILNLPPRPMMGIESCGMLLSAVHKEGDEEKLTLLQVDPHIPAGAKLY
ncbi:MAG: lysine--tRNA ligase [Clostridia bacterium]|nr:lysine--tRNA ligase [Clostridia bacterium]